MKSRRTLRRRIVFVALIGLCSAGALSMFLVGLSRFRSAMQDDRRLSEMQLTIQEYVDGMKREASLLASGSTGASVHRLAGYIEEAEELIDQFESRFNEDFHDLPDYGGMESEWTELLLTEDDIRNSFASAENGIKRARWRRYTTDLEAFAGHFEAVHESIQESIAVERQGASWLCSGGIAAAALASVFSVWLFLTLVCDIASDTYDPEKLEEEVRTIEGSRQFESRMRLLVPSGEREQIHGEWRLKVEKRMREQRTHVCFEAVATNEGRTVRLWGRRYKWAGYLKSFQRLVFPAFADATWKTLCHMHSNGLDCPVPLVYRRLRVGPFKAGSLILMENIGDVYSVKNFLRGDFCHLSTERQNELLRQIAEFVDTLHGLGIYGIKSRYLHGQNLSDPEQPSQLYLFDLDKVLLWKSCPSFMDRLLSWKDKKRLVRKVESHLSEEQIRILRRRQQKPVEGE